VVSPTPTGSPFARVLAGTDGSDRAQEAVRQAARIARLGGTLDVVFVIDAGRAHADAEREAERALARAEEVAAAEGLVATTRVLAGDPPDTLVAEAEAHRADLLCVGSDADLLGGVIRIGHIAADAMRRARCSVLLARRAGPSFPSRIECGIDGSASSSETAGAAAGLAAAAGAELRLLHVVPVFRGANAEWTLADDEESPAEILDAVRAATDRGLVPVREMAMGRPEHALVVAAGRDGVDLLIVGHRERGGVARMLLGSVSEHSALHAPCSVLVARTGERA
jgi:nucleotide-binding universal stress UspA family protein